MMALMALFRWYVEYQKNNDCVVIGETEPNQSVYLFKCENSTVQVADFPAVFFHICGLDICHETDKYNYQNHEYKSQLSRAIDYRLLYRQSHHHQHHHCHFHHHHSNLYHHALIFSSGRTEQVKLPSIIKIKYIKTDKHQSGMLYNYHHHRSHHYHHQVKILRTDLAFQ